MQTVALRPVTSIWHSRTCVNPRPDRMLSDIGPETIYVIADGQPLDDTWFGTRVSPTNPIKPTARSYSAPGASVT